MGGAGVELRMRILRDAADQQLLKPFRTLGWEATISSENESGEYLILTATKSGKTRRVALMYSSATKNEHYKTLDADVDHILTNGALYHINEYAYGITTPLTPIHEFYPTLVAWNKELTPAAESPVAPVERPRSRTVRRIIAESPLESIWARLNQFASIQLADKLVRLGFRQFLSYEVGFGRAGTVALDVFPARLDAGDAVHGRVAYPCRVRLRADVERPRGTRCRPRKPEGGKYQGDEKR